jgi:hypothetical protein
LIWQDKTKSVMDSTLSGIIIRTTAANSGDSITMSPVLVL